MSANIGKVNPLTAKCAKSTSAEAPVDKNAKLAKKKVYHLSLCDLCANLSDLCG